MHTPMAVEIANCFDNGGGRVVAASTTLDGECGEVSPHGQKWKPGVWASIASRSTVKMMDSELGRFFACQTYTFISAQIVSS